MFTEKKFDTGQVVINYAEGAASGAPMVLLHGATVRWQSWNPFLSQLESLWHVYACDLRGHGKSGRVPSHYRVVDYCPDISAFIQQVIGESTILIGLSLGGILSPGIAAQIPDFMRAVALLDPPFFTREVSIKDSGWPFDYFLGVQDILSGERTLEEVCTALGWEVAEMQDWFNDIRGTDIDMVTTLLNDHLNDGFDLQQALQKMTCPSLLLYGEQEKGSVVRKRDIEFFHANAPNGVSAPIKDAGHILHLDQPSQVLDQITRFLNGI